MLKFRRLLSVIFALILFGLTPHAAAKSGSTKIVGDEIEIMSASGEHFSEYSGANVLDGDLSNQSVFASRLNPADLFLDLGEVWTVESLRLAWGGRTERTYEFEIATRASENEAWSTVFYGNSSGQTTEFEPYAVIASQARFIRIRGLSNSRGSPWTLITEARVHGRPAMNDMSHEIDIISASGEHFSEYLGANVLDGDLSNQSVFASRSNPADLFLDLGEVWTVESLRLAWGGRTERTYEFEIATRASENEAWSTVFYGNSSGQTTEFEPYAVIASQARFIRIRGLSNSRGSPWTLITEVRAFGQSVLETVTQLEHFGEPITLIGANIPWSSNAGFSADFGWYNPLNIEAYRNHFSRLENVGANSARVWLHTTAQVTPDIDPSGTVLSLSHISSDEVVIDQLRSVLDEAWARGIVVNYSLFSFDMFCDSFGDDFGYNNYLDIERHKIMVEENYQSYIDNALKPIVNGLKDHPGLFAYEIFNEPEGAIRDMTDAGHFCSDEANVPGDGLSFPLSLAGAQRFVNRTAAAIHEIDPNVKVTTSTHTDFFESFNNETLISQPGANQNGTLDFYELHHYPFYENPPYITSVDIYEADRPIIIGEYDLADVRQESRFQTDRTGSLSAIINQGYVGAWPWSLLNDNLGQIDATILNLASDTAIDRAAVEACIETRDRSCYKQ